MAKWKDSLKIVKNSRDTQGPFTSQTQARQVAKVMSERGEDVYMWEINGDYTVSLDHPTNIDPTKVTRFPASSSPRERSAFLARD